MRPVRPVRRAVHGVLLLDKPLGLTSRAALQRARHLLGAAKAGHAGTLDPLATGLLVLCFGAATKFAQAGLDADKAYRATLRLGVTTATGDGEGAVLAERPVDLADERVEAVCRGFVGEIDQVPPMHSALKHEGRALYDYARAGIEVERAPRRVTIHAIDPVGRHGPLVTVDVRCSKGTYLRALAGDIGAALGCGAHLAALRRTASGAFGIDDACTLDDLEALDEGGRDARLKPVDALLAGWPAERLGGADAARFLNGLSRRIDGLADRPRLRVYGPPADGADSVFLGTARSAGGELVPTRLLSPNELMN